MLKLKPKLSVELGSRGPGNSLQAAPPLPSLHNQTEAHLQQLAALRLPQQQQQACPKVHSGATTEGIFAVSKAWLLLQATLRQGGGSSSLFDPSHIFEIITS